MNLRDLIFSQSQNDSTQQQLATIDSCIAEDRLRSSAPDYSEVANASNSDSSPEERKRKRSSYRVHYTAPYPNPGEEKHPLYRDCPEVKFISSTVQPCNDTPGLSAGLKFPKHLFATSSDSGRPTLANGLRMLIRDIWNISFLAKDFQLAAMALGLLSEVGSVTASDIRAAGELLRYSDQEIGRRSGNINMETTPLAHEMNNYSLHDIESNTTSVTNVRKLVLGLLRANDTKDLDSVGVSIELLLGLGEAKAAQMVLQKSSRKIAAAHTTVYYCLDTILVIFKACSFALKISSLLGLNAYIPSLRRVCEDPLQFYRCVHIVRIVAEGNLTFGHSMSSAKKKNSSRTGDKAALLRQYRPICRQLINELKSTFRMSVVNPMTKSIQKSSSESHNSHEIDSDTNHNRQNGNKRNVDSFYDCVELIELYGAYLAGLGQEKMAITFLKQSMSASKLSAVVEDNGCCDGDFVASQTVASQYMTLYAKFVARFHCSIPFSPTTTILTENAKLCSVIRDRILPTLENWVHHNCSTNPRVGPSLKLLATGLILYRLNRLKRSKLLSIVTSALECLDCSQGEMAVYHSQRNLKPIINKIRSKYYPIHWLLWRLLSVDILGKLPLCSTDEPISSNSKILRHLSSTATIFATYVDNTDRLHPTNGFGYLSGKHSLHSLSADSACPLQSIAGAAPIANDCSSPLRKESIQQKFRRCCGWWDESLLSSSCIGELSSTVMEFEASAYLDGLPPSISNKQVKELPMNIVMNNFMNYQRSTTLFHSASRDAYHESSQTLDSGSDSSESSEGNYLDSTSGGEAHENLVSIHYSDSDREQVEVPESVQMQDESLLHLLSIAVDFNENGDTAAAPQYLDICYRNLVDSTALLREHPNMQKSTNSDTNQTTTTGDNSDGTNIDGEDSYCTWKMRLPAFIPQHIKELYHRHLYGSTIPSVADKNDDRRAINMDLSEGKDRFAKKRILASTVKNTLGRAPYETVLGHRILEILAFQAIVSAHLSSQDNLFTIRAVQVISLHALRVDTNFQRSPEDNSLNKNSTSAGYCLRMMVNAGINVVRAIRIGTLLARENTSMTITAPPSYHLLDPSEVGFNVAGGESSYNPVG